jgi:hypothetical protein
MFKLKNDRFHKRLANRIVRKCPVLVSGRSYKKAFNSWEICDYKSYPSTRRTRWLTEEELIELIKKERRK